MVIASAQNPRIKAVAALQRRRERERSKLMPVEGYDELRVAMASGARPISIYHCRALQRDPTELSLAEQARSMGAEIFEVTETVFEKLAYRENPDGWLGVFPAIATGLERLETGDGALLLVCDSVEKPGNLGAMLRTADAAGVQAVIASPATTDWGNPNVVRASKGALFTVPVAEAAPEELLAWLRERGTMTVAASPEALVPLTEVDLQRAVAIIVGSESRGLSATWAAAPDVTVRIPMFGRVNSLNVATSAALLVYEALRQRGRLT